MMTTLRIATLGLLAPLLIGAASSVHLPVTPICNRTALYLLAEYKVAIGDTRSAVELLNRAAAPATPRVSCPSTQIRERT